MDNDPVLWLPDFLAAYEGTSTTLAKVLRVSGNDVFRVDHLVGIAIVNRCSYVYKNQTIKYYLRCYYDHIITCLVLQQNL